jgi:N-acetylmuramoyl-L-alanine amidase
MTYRLVVSLCCAIAWFAVTASAEIKKPLIVAKSSWSKTEPQSSEMIPIGSPIRTIVVHHTAFPTELKLAKKQMKAREQWKPEKKAESYQSQHRVLLRKFGVKKGTAWGDIAYHYFIDTDGTIVEARKDTFRGDSNTPYDMTGKLLVVLEGNFEFQQPSDKQKNALNHLVSWLAKTNNVPAAMISGHRDQRSTKAAKAVGSLCPGKNLYSYLPELRQYVATELLK